MRSIGGIELGRIAARFAEAVKRSDDRERDSLGREKIRETIAAELYRAKEPAAGMRATVEVARKLVNSEFYCTVAPRSPSQPSAVTIDVLVRDGLAPEWPARWDVPLAVLLGSKGKPGRLAAEGKALPRIEIANERCAVPGVLLVWTDKEQMALAVRMGRCGLLR